MAEITDSPRQPGETDLFLNHLRVDLRQRLIPGEPTPPQVTALEKVEAALVAYLSFFYPHDPAQ